MSQSQSLSELYHLLKPYFGLKGTALLRSLASLFILASNLIAAFTMVAVNTGFEALMGAATAPGLTYPIFFGHLASCFWHVTIYCSFRLVNFALASWLGDSLSHALDKDLIDTWIGSKSYYGLKFVNQKENDDKSLNPANVLGQDVNTITGAVAYLGDSLATTTFDFVIGVYQLWMLSVPLPVTIMSVSFVVPGYMLVGAVIYGGLYNIVVSKLDGKLRQQTEQLSAKQDKFVAHLHHINEHGEEIALKKGQAKEQADLNHNLEEFVLIKSVKRTLSSSLQFIQIMNHQFNQMLGLALCAPGIIQGYIHGNIAFSLSGYFSSVVEFFSWHKNNVETITNLNVSQKRLAAFKDLMKAWESTLDKKDIKLKAGKQLMISNLSLSKPNGEAIVKNLNLKLPQGKATVIQGPSGIGKSTLFRALSNVWPYVQGELILPVNKGQSSKIYFIPQKPYFPHQGKLIDAIAYPNQAITAQQLKMVKTLMKKMKFNQGTIDSLEQHGDWGNTLSGGEQQRIAIIGAIINKPDVLFMDEGTSAIDGATKKIVETCLKQYLKSTTIVAIDHNPSGPDTKGKSFYDNTLSMQPDKQTGQAKLKLKAYQ